MSDRVKIFGGNPYATGMGTLEKSINAWLEADPTIEITGVSVSAMPASAGSSNYSPAAVVVIAYRNASPGTTRKVPLAGTIQA